MNSLARGLGEAASGNPRLCSGSKSPQAPRSGSGPLPPPFWLGAQDRLHAEAGARGRDTPVRGNLGRCGGGGGGGGGQSCSRSVALAPGGGGTAGCRIRPSCGSRGPTSHQLRGPGQFQSSSGPVLLTWTVGMTGTVERAPQARPQEAGGRRCAAGKSLGTCGHSRPEYGVSGSGMARLQQPTRSKEELCRVSGGGTPLGPHWRGRWTGPLCPPPLLTSSRCTSGGTWQPLSTGPRFPCTGLARNVTSADAPKGPGDPDPLSGCSPRPHRKPCPACAGESKFKA